MPDETATATQTQTDASAQTEASATSTAAAADGTDGQQQTQTAESSTATAAETAADGSTKTETAGAPDAYTFTAPEGTEYDSGILEAFSAAAKQANLTQDAAQKLIETMAPALAARQNDQVKAIQEEWRNASNSDKEFGGANVKENLGIARKALDTFDPPKVGTDGKPETTPLRVLLETTGLGNHPEVLRFLYRAGKAISEDKFVGGKTGNAQAATDAQSLYPNSTMN